MNNTLRRADPPAWTEKDLPDQAGRTVVVTGANSGLGYLTSLELAKQGHFRKQPGRTAERMGRCSRGNASAPGRFAQAKARQAVLGQDLVGGANQGSPQIAVVIAIGRAFFRRLFSVHSGYLYTVQIML